MSVHLYPSGFEAAAFQPKIGPNLTLKETDCLSKLLALPFDFVLDSEREDQACKLLGQKFFDTFKAEAHGHSEAAKKSLQKICESIPFYCTQHGRERKEHVSKSWEGIGDCNWQWNSSITG